MICFYVVLITFLHISRMTSVDLNVNSIKYNKALLTPFCFISVFSFSDKMWEFGLFAPQALRICVCESMIIVFFVLIRIKLTEFIGFGWDRDRSPVVFWLFSMPFFRMNNVSVEMIFKWQLAITAVAISSVPLHCLA